jgi:hypothetical protein
MRLCSTRWRKGAAGGTDRGMTRNATRSASSWHKSSRHVGSQRSAAPTPAIAAQTVVQVLLPTCNACSGCSVTVLRLLVQAARNCTHQHCRCSRLLLARSCCKSRRYGR